MAGGTDRYNARNNASYDVVLHDHLRNAEWWRLRVLQLPQRVLDLHMCEQDPPPSRISAVSPTGRTLVVSFSCGNTDWRFRGRLGAAMGALFVGM